MASAVLLIKVVSLCMAYTFESFRKSGFLHMYLIEKLVMEAFIIMRM